MKSSFTVHEIFKKKTHNKNIEYLLPFEYIEFLARKKPIKLHKKHYNASMIKKVSTVLF